MYGIRKDGVAVKLPLAVYTTKEQAIDFAKANKFLAVMLDGNYIFAGSNPFTKQNGNLRTLKTVPDNAQLFTDSDPAIRDVSFYLRGLFGINSKNEKYTRLHVSEFTAASGNCFKIFLRGEDIVFLATQSPAHLSISDVRNDAITLAAETHGLGKSIGLVITPQSTGYFNLKS
jgi:hypothetical protein